MCRYKIVGNSYQIFIAPFWDLGAPPSLNLEQYLGLMMLVSFSHKMKPLITIMKSELLFNLN